MRAHRDVSGRGPELPHPIGASVRELALGMAVKAMLDRRRLEPGRFKPGLAPDTALAVTQCRRLGYGISTSSRFYP